MRTECNQKAFGFHGLGRREGVAGFDGGRITSAAGGLLLRGSDVRAKSDADETPLDVAIRRKRAAVEGILRANSEKAPASRLSPTTPYSAPSS